MMPRAFRIFLAIILLGGCAGAREPLPITPPGEMKGAPVVRRPLDQPPATPTASAPQSTQAASPATGAPPPIVVPPDTLYVCVTENRGRRQQIAIEFTPRVGALCKRHPEMGPCQYERDVCRQSGGRVYAANG